jgi:hypothetical protein
LVPSPFRMRAQFPPRKGHIMKDLGDLLGLTTTHPGMQEMMQRADELLDLVPIEPPKGYGILLVIEFQTVNVPFCILCRSAHAFGTSCQFEGL